MRPSIFSTEYEKKMKKRKKRTLYTVLVLIIICIIIILGANVQGLLNKGFKYKGALSLNKLKIFQNFNGKSAAKADKLQDNKSNNNSTAVEKNKEAEEKGYNISLSNGSNIKAVYETKDNANKFKYVSPVDNNVYYNISPTGNNMVVYDDKVQSMILIDINGNRSDITNRQYTSTDGSRFDKEDVLKSHQGYVWANYPRFIDDEHIAYASQLPWIDSRTTKYVWIYNTKSKLHILYEGLGADNIKFENVTDKGLLLNLDSKTKYLRNDGSVVEN